MLILGLAAMIPFMDTTLWEGPAAKALGGADLAFYIGPDVATVVYLTWRRLGTSRAPRPLTVVRSSVAPGGSQ